MYFRLPWDHKQSRYLNIHRTTGQKSMKLHFNGKLLNPAAGVRSCEGAWIQGINFIAPCEHFSYRQEMLHKLATVRLDLNRMGTKRIDPGGGDLLGMATLWKLWGLRPQAKPPLLIFSQVYSRKMANCTGIGEEVGKAVNRGFLITGLVRLIFDCLRSHVAPM